MVVDSVSVLGAAAASEKKRMGVLLIGRIDDRLAEEADVFVLPDGRTVRCG